MTNPVQLLFGTFDFAFVCIYLLPLLVFASSYNVLSGDKELGILSLTASQPISLYKWLLHKLLIRLLLLSLIVAVAYLIGLGILGINSNLAAVLKLLVPIIIYMGFWFGLAFVVNLMGRPSGTNAITLVALWLVIVLLIPAVISQTINTLHPVPSRVKIIHEYREAYSDALKNIDKIMGVYLRDHPELAAQNESVESRYGFMLRTFASASVINQAIDPVLTGYNEALKKQQARVNQMMLLSPALLLQKVFSQTAGTTASHYADFQQQIIDFTETWKDYLKPRMFANELLRSEDFSSFPRYQYSDERVPDTIGRLTFLLGFFLLLIGAISIWIYKKKKTQLVVY